MNYKNLIGCLLAISSSTYSKGYVDQQAGSFDCGFGVSMCNFLSTGGSDILFGVSGNFQGAIYIKNGISLVCDSSISRVKRNNFDFMLGISQKDIKIPPLNGGPLADDSVAANGTQGAKGFLGNIDLALGKNMYVSYSDDDSASWIRTKTVVTGALDFGIHIYNLEKHDEPLREYSTTHTLFTSVSDIYNGYIDEITANSLFGGIKLKFNYRRYGYLLDLDVKTGALFYGRSEYKIYNNKATGADSSTDVLSVNSIKTKQALGAETKISATANYGHPSGTFMIGARVSCDYKSSTEILKEEIDSGHTAARFIGVKAAGDKFNNVVSNNVIVSLFIVFGYSQI